VLSSAFVFRTGSTTVNQNQDFSFNNTGPYDGITHTSGTQLTVGSAGTYQVDYCITVSAEFFAELAVTVNGVPNSSTHLDVNQGIGSVCGVALLSLQDGDVLTLRQVGLSVTTVGTGVSAQLSIIQVA
jgi:hypothetical protein